MLPAMLNRATMRVADTTEVSGRVTADSREKQTMKPNIRRWLALVIASMGLYLVLPDRGLAQNDQGSGIKLVVPNGTYVFRDTGYLLPNFPSGTPLVRLAAAGRVTYFPTSNLGGTTSGVVTASIDGQISSFTVNGTFTVNADGSVSATETQTEGKGIQD